MSHNDADDFALRLYARVPAHYRYYDVERGYPLLALLRIVGAQVSVVRRDLDALWDNFFIETCDDWVVPYIGALVAAHPLVEPMARIDRLNVLNSVRWQRSKGTPAQLGEAANAMSGWPIESCELFQRLAQAQNVNYPRPDNLLTTDLRDAYRLSLLGRAADPFTHAADVKPAHPLDQTRVMSHSRGIGRAAWGTPGRYTIKNVGYFARRLQTFRLCGVTPAAVRPGQPPPTNAACFTFDPLFRDTPLFVQATAAPLSRAAFEQAPWQTFGTDVAVRHCGVLLASDAEPAAQQASQPRDVSPRSWHYEDSEPTAHQPDGQAPFTFGGAAAGLRLRARGGMRLADPRAVYRGGPHFIIMASWQEHGETRERIHLGTLSTFHAARDGDGYKAIPDAATRGPGQLVVTVRTGHQEPEWPDLPPSPPGRFPGAVLVVRAAHTGAWRTADALYVYLPAAFVTPGSGLTYHVADDGSTYANGGGTTPAATLDPARLARPSEGPVYPARPLDPSRTPAGDFALLNRTVGGCGMYIVDQARFGGADHTAAVLVEAGLLSAPGTPIGILGALATIDQAPADYPNLYIHEQHERHERHDRWPAFHYVPSKAARDGTLPGAGMLCIHLRPLSGSFVPPCELVVTNRAGHSLLVYLPELSGVGPDGVWLLVADDGSTYFLPEQADPVNVAGQMQSGDMTPARAAAGQVLPIATAWPLQQRQPVALDLSDCAHNAVLQFGELGIDPELGRFALAPDDPLVTHGDLARQGELSVDYVEAFGGPVGARPVGDEPSVAPTAPTRLVARSGDAMSALNQSIAANHIHSSVREAIEKAVDGDVIEIADSATYPDEARISIPAHVKTLTLRARADQRPCLTFYEKHGEPTTGSLHVAAPMLQLNLAGLLISGGPVQIEHCDTLQLQLAACTLDPHQGASLVASDSNLQHNATFSLSGCIVGAIHLEAGVGQFVVADSIVAHHGGIAIEGTSRRDRYREETRPDATAQRIELERVTMLGRLRCDVLYASDCLFDARVTVADQQTGYIRFSRYEPGSTLPRRYHCVPSDTQRSQCAPPARCLAPLFNSRRFGYPTYMQLAAACPPEILTAAESGTEVGAFARGLNAARLHNLDNKLHEFLPAGQSAIYIAET